MVALLLPSENSNFYGYNLQGVTHTNFLVPVFQGCDLCDINENTESFLFDLENELIIPFARWV